MTKEQEERLSFTLAIYRGLPDAERQERLDKMRRAKYYRTDFEGKVYAPEQRTLAVIFLPYLEKAEREIQAHREEVVRLEVERQLRQMYRYPVQAEPPEQAPASREGARVLGGISVAGLGVYGAYLLIALLVESGILLWLFGGLLAIAVLSALPRPGGRSSDDEKKTGGSTVGAQNIHINIAGHGGQIHVTQGQ